MKRTDWMKQLAAVIAAAQTQPFVWGTHDCCLFASDCAKAITGVDPAERYRGTYTTEIGAKRALTKHHGSIEAAFDACFKRIDPAFIQRGDLVLLDSEIGHAAGVVWGHGIWSVSPTGTGMVDANPIIAWRVE